MNEVLLRIMVLILLSIILYFIPTPEIKKFDIINDLRDIDENYYFPENEQKDLDDISEYL